MGRGFWRSGRSAVSTSQSATGSESPPAVELRGVGKHFELPGAGTRSAVREVSFSAPPGSFTAIIGPSGCGKSTLLSMLSGLQSPDAGDVLLDGQPRTGVGSNVGFMFQNDAVFPWKTVLANVAAGPRFRGAPREQARSAAADWVRRVGLAGFERHHPHQLSGGMRKRLALAQVLVTEPRVLLMDEPFAGLDAQTRQLMAEELVELWEQVRPSVVLVTHDLAEAVAVADSVVVLTAGPAAVKEQFPVDLPRPRRVGEVRHDPAFLALHERIWEALREEVQVAHERATTPAQPVS